MAIDRILVGEGRAADPKTGRRVIYSGTRDYLDRVRAWPEANTFHWVDAKEVAANGKYKEPYFDRI